MELENTLSGNDSIDELTETVVDENTESDIVSDIVTGDEFIDESVDEAVVEGDEESSSDTLDTVSGGDVLDSDLDGNDSIVSFDDTAILTEISLLREDIISLGEVVTDINMLLLMLVFFVVFKWCENKIKNFRKGFYKK